LDTMLKLPVSVHKERNQYVAVCPIFHVASQGKTVEEALANVKEALELFLEDEDVQKEFSEKIIEHTVSEFESYVVDVKINDEERVTHTIST